LNIFTRIFKKKDIQSLTRAGIVEAGAAQFTAWGGGAYDSDLYRGAVDAIARNAAKLKASHVIKSGGIRQSADEKINRLLQVQPNPYMSAFDMLYRFVTHYYLYNNAFAYLDKDGRGDITAIYPIRAGSMDFMSDNSGAFYCRFRLSGGNTVILPYADIIHLRRHFNSNDLLGENNNAIIPALELAHTQNEGIIQGIKSGARIRGILKFEQILNPEKMKQEKDRFIDDYLSISNEGGVIATDMKTAYQPLELKPAIIDEKQTEAAKIKIYDYLGISSKIVNSSYNEDEWAAFYESVIEPLAVQMSLEFTRKIFNDREQAFGNSILFESGRLQFSSNSTKVKLIAELMPYGLLTVNQALEILNLPAVADGDKRLQTLNVVDASKANIYQLEGNA